MKVHLDNDLCTGHGLCYGLAPKVYDADDDGHAIVLLPQVPQELREQADLGARNCPERAITVED